mgnify:CR=1 FL=1
MKGKNIYNRNVVFISVDPWKEERWARKQMLAWLLSHRFKNVVYYVAPGSSERSLPHLRRIKSNLYLVDIPFIPKFLRGSGLSRLGVQISCSSLWLLLLFIGTKKPVFVTYHSTNFAFTKKLASFFGKSLICYDLTDDWTEFQLTDETVKNEVKQSERKTIEESDVVLAVSKKLNETARKINPKTYYLPNATDVDNFRRTTTDIPVSPEIMRIPGPRIGYIGKVALWKTDFDLLEYLASTRPDWSLIFLGPVVREANLPADKLSEYANVHFLGPRNYNSLPEYIKGFDVCILPHVVDPLTNSMDPIKLYDYLATGKQIVSTPVAEAIKFKEVIRIAYSNDEFVKQIEAAIQHSRDYNPARQLELAGQHSWESRAAELSRIIEDNISK